MQLTQKVLERFKGGRVEIRNPGEDCVHAGTAKEVWIDDDELHIRFATFESGGCDLQFPMWWVDKECLHFAAILELFLVENVGRISGAGYGSSIGLVAPLSRHMITLHPPEVRRLEPVQTEGHQFAHA